MAEYVLQAQTLLGGYDQQFGAIRLREITGADLISAAIPQGGEAAIGKELKRLFGCALPSIGKSVIADDVRIIRLGADQLFVLMDERQSGKIPDLKEQLSSVAYLTDQSDSWVMLEIEGQDVRLALERICMLDLDPQTFAIDDLARTLMEHMGAVIVRTSEDRFLLMSASSSALSFLHSVVTSVRNIS